MEGNAHDKFNPWKIKTLCACIFYEGNARSWLKGNQDFFRFPSSAHLKSWSRVLNQLFQLCSRLFGKLATPGYRVKVYSVGRRNKNTGSNKSFTSEFTLHGPGYALFLLNSIRSLSFFLFFQGLFSPPPPRPPTDSIPLSLSFFFPRFRLPPVFDFNPGTKKIAACAYLTL